jgi:hypothetical protein
MKCEHFVLNHETGSALARLRARLHARRCAKCAAAQRRLAELGRALAAPADLTPYHRRVWERAAADAAPQLAPARQWLTPPRLALAGGLAVAAAVVVAIVLSVGGKQMPGGASIVKNVDPPNGIETQLLKESAAELAELEAGLDQMEKSLNRLAQEAELLEARRAISELAALYPPLGSGDSS